MNHRTSTESQPWWADVAHLQGRAGDGASSHGDASQAPRPSRSIAARDLVPDRGPAPVAFDRTPAASVAARRPRATRAGRTEREGAERPRRGSRPSERAPRGRERRSGASLDAELHRAGRESSAPAPSLRPARPRATLVDVAPTHALLSRPVAVRRAPGERPTVTITGRPEAALPPRVAPPREVPGRRVREGASSLVSSPDRLILWAVALGLLMILASIGTASADAAMLLR